MYFKDYEQTVLPLAIYPGRHDRTTAGVVYCTLGLTGEAGEFADKVKKILRDDGGVISPEKRMALLSEGGDVLWYLAAVFDELGSSLDEVAKINIDKLTGRRDRGTLGGSGDER
jgi:NTP pyrophosphatase (non-canonical NTP hydrolase)